MAFNLTLDQVKQLEARGAELARQCKLDGEEILAIAYHALTEANYHKEATLISDIMDDEEHVFEA